MKREKSFPMTEKTHVNLPYSARVPKSLTHLSSKELVCDHKLVLNNYCI